MSEWKTYKLGDLGTLARGKSKHRPRDASFLYGGKYPFIQTGDIKAANHKISSHNQTLSDEGLKQSKLWDKGTICITIAANIADTAILAYPACFPDSVIGFVPNKEVCDVDFMEYQLQFAKRNLQSHSIGSVQDNINLGTFQNFTVTIPDLPTQTQIAQILSSLDDKIELNLQMNQTLEAMAQALFKEWFVNFNFPSSELGLEGLNDDRIFYKKGKKENKEILPTSNQQNHNSDNLPKGWRMGKLGDISTNFDNKRVPLSSMQRKDRQGIYPYYGAATIFDYIDDYIFDGTFLLMGEDGTVQTDEGFPLLQYVWGKFWVNNHTHVLQGKIPFSTEYLYLLLSKTNITHLITGAVQPKINQGNMNKIECVLPTVQILNDFQKVIDPIFEKIKSNKIQIQSLTQTRDTLLPKLMSGKIKLSELGLGGLNDDRILVKKTNKEILKSSNPKNHNSDKK